MTGVLAGSASLPFVVAAVVVVIVMASGSVVWAVRAVASKAKAWGDRVAVGVLVVVLAAVVVADRW